MTLKIIKKTFSLNRIVRNSKAYSKNDLVNVKRRWEGKCDNFSVFHNALLMENI